MARFLAPYSLLTALIAWAIVAVPAEAQGRMPSLRTGSLEGAPGATYREGAVAYAQGDYETAAARFETTYDVAPQPSVLFDLALAREQAGRLAAAISSYEAFVELASGDAAAGAAERRLDVLRDRLRAAAAMESEAADASESREITGALSTLGVGGAAFIVAAVVGVMANERHDEAMAAPTQRQTVLLEAQAQDLATATNAAILVGSGVTLSGALWLTLSLALDADDAQDDDASGVALLVRARP